MPAGRRLTAAAGGHERRRTGGFGGCPAAGRSLFSAPRRGASRRVIVFLPSLRPHRRPQDRLPGSFGGGPLAAAAALLLAAIVPAACGERHDRARLAALEAGIASAQASLAALSAAAPPSAAPFPPPSLGAAASTKTAGPAAEATARLPAGQKPDAAADLLGAGPDALLRWFGDPDLRRPEGDADVLLFLGSGCALDVVLYADAGGKRVAHAAARADGPAAVTEADCLRGIGGGRGGVGRAVAAGHTAER